MSLLGSKRQQVTNMNTSNIIPNKGFAIRPHDRDYYVMIKGQYVGYASSHKKALELASSIMAGYNPLDTTSGQKMPHHASCISTVADRLNYARCQSAN